MFFAGRGAKLSLATGNQLPTYKSCLPIGRDFLKGTHTISARSACDYLILLNDKPGTSTGTFMGVSKHCNQPVLLNLFEGCESSNLFIAGNRLTQTETLVATLMMRWALSHDVLFVGDAEPYKYVAEILGPALAKYERFWYPMRTAPKVGHPVRLRMMDLRDKNNDNSTKSVLLDLMDTMRARAAEDTSATSLVIVLDDAVFGSTDRNMTKEFSRFCGVARDAGIALVLFSKQPAVAGEIPWIGRFIRNCRTSLILGQQTADEGRIVAEIFKLTAHEQNAVVAGNSVGGGMQIDALMRDPSGLAKLCFKVSPMEYWLAGLSDVRQQQRASFMAEVRSNDPGLNHTDTCRNALYYLGMNS